MYFLDMQKEEVKKYILFLKPLKKFLKTFVNPIDFEIIK